MADKWSNKVEQARLNFSKIIDADKDSMAFMDIGVDRIYNHNMKLTQYLIDAAIDHGLSISTPVDQDRRGSIVNIQLENSIEKVKLLVRKDLCWMPVQMGLVSYRIFTIIKKI